MKTTMPEKLPVMKAGKLIRYLITNGNGKHCLLGWAGTCVTKDPFDGFENNKITSQLIKIIEPGGDYSDVAKFNNKKPLSAVAAVWNKACRALGYVRRGKWYVKVEGSGAR